MTRQPQHISEIEFNFLTFSSRCVRFITKEMKCRQHNFYTLYFQCGNMFGAQRVNFRPEV